MKKHWKLIALMLVLSMLLSCMLTGCKQANPDATTGDDGQTTTGTRDTLNYGMPQEPGKLDPQNDSLLVAKMTNKQIYDTLFVVDDSTMEIKANLATEWNWVDDLTLDVTIRDDVVFHNGEKLTAHDVAYTLERCAVGNATATLFSSFDVENTVVTDDTHITIKMKQPYASALNVLANAISGIVCKSYAESVDETTFGREPIGTGAFKFVEWVSGDHITLTRNDAYWGHKPAYTTLNLRIINDNSARAIELETGGIDLTDSLTITTDIARFEEDPTIDAYKIPSTKVVYLAFNEQHPILGNETVRRAIAHAIDADSVRKAAYGDGAILATSSIPSTVYGYKNVGGYEYNVELAKQLLAEAGYADGFSFNTVCPSVAASVKTAEAVKAFLAEVNIDMEIEQYDAATWRGTKMRDGSADSAPYNLTADTLDPDQNYMHLYADSGFVTVSTQDETVNRLLVEGRGETDNAKRLAIYAELQEYIKEHVIEIPLVENIINYAAKTYVKGFVPNVGVQPDLKYVYFE